VSDKDLGALLERGLAQQRAGQHKAAIQIFRQVLKRGGTAAPVLCRIGQSYEHLKAFAEADAAYLAAIERAPDHAEAYLRGADLARRASLLADQVGQEAAAHELRDGACRYLTALGTRLMARGAWADAERAFAHARALAPEDWAVHVDLGRAIAAQGRVREGEALIRRGVALGPDHAAAHLHLGELLQRQGEGAAAADAFRRALALDPGLAAAASGLAALGTAPDRDPRSDR
jgi:tetratricopeptide (TPR) repeat protein